MTKNDGRRNGKKFSHRRSNLDEHGRPLSGKGKPSGNSIKGVSRRKLIEAARHIQFMETLKGDLK